MKFHRKVSAALLVVLSLAAAKHSMAYCQTGKDVSWHWTWAIHTLSCGGNNLATFWLNPNGGHYQHAKINLNPGRDYAQLLGLTQSGAYVAGCSVDDLNPDNVPTYLNWNGTQNPSCEQAYIAHIVAGG